MLRLRQLRSRAPWLCLRLHAVQGNFHLRELRGGIGLGGQSAQLDLGPRDFAGGLLELLRLHVLLGVQLLDF
ncbi:MAG: hypothetical protein HZB57_00075 [Gammaproteobacteria bacterium]|nr:hypothetical protein [Gammaproteobacteria bacterium]